MSERQGFKSVDVEVEGGRCLRGLLLKVRRVDVGLGMLLCTLLLYSCKF